MNKKAISAILWAFNICLVFAIVILVVLIVKRGPEPLEEVAEKQQELEEQQQQLQAEQDAAIEEANEQQEVEEILVCVPTSASSVNVRSGPSTDYQRIGSAYMDYEYEVINVLTNGWTYIKYDDQAGYVSSEFVAYKTKYVISGGDDSTATYGEATSDIIKRYTTSNTTVVPTSTGQSEDNQNDMQDEDAASNEAEQIFEELENNGDNN